MTKKRFELRLNSQGQADIIDWLESKEKNAICIYNDLGALPYSSAEALCELLNQLYDENKQLEARVWYLERKKEISKKYNFDEVDWP